MNSLNQLIEEGLKFQKQGQLTKAENKYQEVLELQPNFADAYHLLALIEYQKSNLHSSVCLLEHAIRLDPNQAHYHNSLANVLQDLGKIHSAIEHYTLAISYKKSPEFINNLGTAKKALGQFSQALDLFRLAIQFNPVYAEAYYNIGNLLREQIELESALLHYRKAISCKPNFLEAWLHRAETEQALNLFTDAYHSYINVLKFEPNNYYAQKKVNQLTAIIQQKGASVGLPPAR